MAWLKTGDTAAMDERVLDVAELETAEPWSVNEVFGFVSRLFIQAAQQGSDYRVSMGTAMALSPRYELLLLQASQTGLLELVHEEGRRMIRLVSDADFHHLRTKEEIAHERERKANNSDPSLTVPARRRDGDACRYCGKVVNWADRKGNRGGTYDHLKMPAESWHDLVVACIECNSGKGDGSKGRSARYPLLPAPVEGQQYYSRSTILWLEQNGTVLTELGLTVPKRPRGAKDRQPGVQTRPDATPRDDTGQAEHAATAPSGDQRTATSQTRPDHAATAPSGDQRSGTARDSQTRPADAAPEGDQRGGTAQEHAPQHDPGTEQLTPADTPEMVADAAPHTSGEQRATTTSDVQAERLPDAEVRPEVEQNHGATRRNAPGRSDLDPEGTGSGFAGSGRDGSGRAGPGRDGPGRAGQGRAGSPPGQVLSGKRTKRGRRGRGRR